VLSKPERVRIAAITSIAAPLILAIVVAICGFLRPGYDHATQFVSELGASGTSYSWLLNDAGFMPTGLLTLVTAAVLFTSFQNSLRARIGFGLVAVCASMFIVAAILPCDAGCPSNGSVSNNLHLRLTLLAAFLIGPTIAFVGVEFRRLTLWKPLSGYSIGTGIVALGLMAAVLLTIQSRNGTGLFQRLHFGICLIWLAVVSGRLKRVQEK
jgi:hypothetical membrane protein